MSDDGRDALTVIGFVGSVFSPYYATQRRRNLTDPEQHCAFNVALYGDTARRWCMTERSSSSLLRHDHMLRIGSSAMSWGNDGLTVDIDEWSWPLPRRLRGQLQVTPGPINPAEFVLSQSGHHVWRPIAPTARIEVDLVAPKLHWSGSAYFDCNFGDAPLEEAFVGWDWSRASLSDGSTVVFYDALRRDQSELSLGLRFAPDGGFSLLDSSVRSPLPRSAWGLQRRARSHAAPATLLKSFEDGPFYSRALIGTDIVGEEAQAVHETLSLDRFRRRWVQTLLPFRMPRLAR